MARIRICKEEGCKNAATSGGYCRLHYLKNWKKLKQAEHERAAKKLNRYVESVIRRHPDRYVEIIKKELKSQNFGKLVDDQFGYDEEDNVFNEPTYDEDVRELIEKFRKDSE
jgi:hypothetical protein